MERLAALALVLDVNLDWLATGRGGPSESAPPPTGSDVARNGRQLQIIEIDATAGAGSIGGVVIDERPVATYVIDEVELVDMLDGGSVPKDPFVWRMIGESNEPEFRDGERLIVEPYPEGARQISASGFYLFRLEDIIEVKQLERLPGRKLRISSRNPNYAPYEIQLGEGVDFAILGRVRGRFQRY